MKLDTATDFRVGSNKVCLAIQNQSNAVFYSASNVSLTRTLSGSIGLSKYGSGTLTLSGTNTYTGTTTLNSGILAMGNSSAIGTTGNITFVGGSLQMLSSITRDIGARIKNSTSPIVIDVATSQTWNGVIDSSNNGGFTKQGIGTLTLAPANTLTGPLRYESGTLTLLSANSGISSVVIAGSGTGGTAISIFNNNGVDAAKISFQSTGLSGLVNSFALNTTNGLITFNNSIDVDSTSGRGYLNVFGTSGANIGSQITLIGNGSASGDFVLANSQTNSATVTFSGNISGGSFTRGVSLRGGNSGSNGIFTGYIYVPNGSLAVNGINDWTIYKHVSSNYINVNLQTAFNASGTGNLKAGEVNAFAPNSFLLFASLAVHRFDLNGFDQTFTGVAGPTGAGNIVNTIINNGASPATLTLSGLGGARGFYGTIRDGTSNLSLVMNSTGRVQTLSGSNLWTGYTAISAGTLTIGTLVSGASAKFSNAAFTPSTLTVTFTTPPSSSENYKILNGATINTYASVTLTNGGGKTATYNSSNSTLTIL